MNTARKQQSPEDDEYLTEVENKNNDKRQRKQRNAARAAKRYS